MYFFWRGSLLVFPNDTRNSVQMGVGHSSLSSSSVDSLCITAFIAQPKTSSFSNSSRQKPLFPPKKHSPFSALKTGTLNCARVAGEMEIEKGIAAAGKSIVDLHGIDDGLIQKIVYDALVWSSLHGLVVGDRNDQVYHTSDFYYLLFFSFNFCIYPHVLLSCWSFYVKLRKKTTGRIWLKQFNSWCSFFSEREARIWT